MNDGIHEPNLDDWSGRADSRPFPAGPSYCLLRFQLGKQKFENDSGLIRRHVAGLLRQSIVIGVPPGVQNEMI